MWHLKVGRLLSACVALLIASTHAAHAQKYQWHDHPEYADPFFLWKLKDLPGFSDRHLKLQQVLKNDPTGSKLSQGLTLIKGKEDLISSRIFASWLAQVNEPDVKVQEFIARTTIPMNAKPTMTVHNAREFQFYAVHYFVQVIARRAKFGVEDLFLVGDNHPKLKPIPSAVRNARALTTMAEKINREVNGFKMFDWPTSFGDGMLIAWANYYGRGNDDRAARVVLQQKNVHDFLRLMSFRCMDETIEKKMPGGGVTIYSGDQGARMFAPYWNKYKTNVGVALEVARLGNSHPKQAWEAVQFLLTVKNESPEFLYLFWYAAANSSDGFKKLGHKNVREMVSKIYARKLKAEGFIQKARA